MLPILRSISIAMLICSQGVLAQEGSLFPEPLRVEHHLEHLESGGERMVYGSVTDTYGGSWIVSERLDGSRLIVDFVRHEIIGIQPQRGTYWAVSIDRLADLQQRLAAVEGGQEPELEVPGLGASSAQKPALVVEEVSGLSAAGQREAGLAHRPGVLHYRAVDPSQSVHDRAAFEASFDPSVRMSAEATAALDSLASKLSGGASDSQSPGGGLGAMREAAGGAFAIRTSRAMSGESQGEISRMDDIATKVERLDTFPGELLEIPDGFVRVSHPLEATIRYLEQDEEWRRQIGGGEETP